MNLALRRVTSVRAVSSPSNSPASAAALFEAEYEPMLRLAFVLTRDQHQAEDVVQEAFLDVQQRWAALLNPGGYLRTAVVNGCHRWRQREGNRSRILRENVVVLGTRPAPAQDTYIVDVLDRLPERQRSAVVLAYYCGLGARDIAETLDCRPGTAKSLVHRGLRRLRKELEE